MNTLPTVVLEALQQQCRTLHLTTVAQVLMYFNPFDYRTNQTCLEEWIQQDQACHAQQR